MGHAGRDVDAEVDVDVFCVDADVGGLGGYGEGGGIGAGIEVRGCFAVGGAGVAEYLVVAEKLQVGAAVVEVAEGGDDCTGEGGVPGFRQLLECLVRVVVGSG